MVGLHLLRSRTQQRLRLGEHRPPARMSGQRRDRRQRRQPLLREQLPLRDSPALAISGLLLGSGGIFLGLWHHSLLNHHVTVEPLKSLRPRGPEPVATENAGARRRPGSSTLAPNDVVSGCTRPRSRRTPPSELRIEW